jgi:hypothetical protein
VYEAAAPKQTDNFIRNRCRLLRIFWGNRNCDDFCIFHW